MESRLKEHCHNRINKDIRVYKNISLWKTSNNVTFAKRFYFISGEKNSKAAGGSVEWMRNYFLFRNFTKNSYLANW